MGGKSGGGGHTPKEAPDSLLSSQRLRAIGLISLGPIKGSVNWWKSTYLDNTVVQNESGVDENDTDSFNFKNLEIQYTLGTQDQPVLKGFEGSEREVSVGTEVKKQHSITRSVVDPDVTRLRLTIGVNALFSQNDQGDTNGTSVNFRVLINGQARGNYEINGKSSSRFYRNYIIDDLPPRPFTLTVERLTEDSKSQRLQNATHWVSYTEIIDTKLNYPNMALVGIKADSRYTPNFPNVNFLLYGRIIKIPSTYDPEKRTYAAGIWKGDWKLGWTNNPAWIFYDLITNKMAGLGQRIGDYGIDKFQLYEIAKYCDELVDDGYGDKEPRMVANLWITEQREAYNVISDMASVFRAIAVWDGTQLTAIQDRPTDPVCLYTQANIVNGKITRQYAAGKAIFTAVEVEYADERNMYQKAIEYIADDGMIARYGYNVKKITAFGCTSRGQAHRYGKWVLETSRLEQCTISFTVGRQGLMHLPGDIIEVADNNYAGQTIGGRVVAVAGKRVTLDRAVEISENSYLSYLNTDHQLAKSKIISAQGAVVTLDAAPNGLKEYDDWVLKTPTVSTQLYRALDITENEDGSYTISALQHEPQKEAIVDGSASFDPTETTTHRAGMSPVSRAEITADGGKVGLTFEPPASFIGQGLKYQVKLYRDGNLFDVYDDLQQPTLAFNDLPDGDYIAEIRSKNFVGQLSEPVTKSFSVNFDIKELVTVSKVMGIDLNWRNPIFANTNAAIEIWVSKDDNFQHARKLVTLAYPTNSYSYTGLGAAETYYFWARMVSKDVAGKFTAAVVGVTERDATKIVDYIHGQTSKSALTQELVGELTGTSQAVNAAKSMAENAIAKVLAEAQTRGTQINELKQVDERQAQAIRTVTVKADNALSGIAAEQKARADGDRANADQINAVTARVGSVESSIVQMQHTATTNNQSVAHQLNEVNAKLTPIQQKLDEKLDALVKTTLDLTGLDQNKWYPVTFDRIPTVGRANLIVRQNLIPGVHAPTWAAHDSKSFSLLCDWTVNGAGWGTINIDRQVNVFECDWLKDNKSPILNIGQLSFSSIEYCCLRGGAKYDVFAPREISVVLQTSDYTKNSNGYTQTVSVIHHYDATQVPKSELKSLNANVSIVSKAVAGVSGKLSATHTIKTQVVAGGRTAIAGIALGASSDGRTAESSVIVMADKFGVVKNAADGAVQNIFTIANGSTALSGDLIADGSIVGRHIRANTELSAPNIKGGTITGNTINGGTINGTTVSGSVVKGSTIEGGVIKATRLEGVTGKFSGTLEVNSLIGSNILEIVTFNDVLASTAEFDAYPTTKYHHSFYRKINIAASNIPRIFYVLNSNFYREIPANQSMTIEYLAKNEGTTDPSWTPPEIFNKSIFNKRGTASITCMLIALTSRKTLS